MAKGEYSQNTPPEKIFLENTPLASRPADPPSRRAKRAGKFLGFFGDFSRKFRVFWKIFGVFSEFSGIFRVFSGLIMIKNRI